MYVTETSESIFRSTLAYFLSSVFLSLNHPQSMIVAHVTIVVVIVVFSSIALELFY